MRGLLHIGETNYSGGRAGDQPSIGLSASLEKFGFELGRLKTGTPPRVNKRSINYAVTEEQPGEDDVKFSFEKQKNNPLPQVSCHITYTTDTTKKIINANLHRSPMYSGKITGVGPRYCPSIEDKVVRFADKERHQIFLEPEGITTQEVYVNGISSSLPFDVQLDVIHSVIGLEQAEIMRPAYAIEYDYVVSGQVSHSLESKKIEGLFFAGQINGTSGYEEAAAQGMIAGINAANKVKGSPEFILGRSEAYIGVMIDDLVTNGTGGEPYRMFTSRAEYRLLLRQDNADMRLTEHGYKLGLISSQRYQDFCQKKDSIESEIQRLKKVFVQIDGKGFNLSQLLCRPENTYESLLKAYPDLLKDCGEEANFQIELNAKYEGYLKRQEIDIKKLSYSENIKIPLSFDYKSVVGLRAEALQKLLKFQPQNLGQASRISGVSPADISILRIALAKQLASFAAL